MGKSAVPFWILVFSIASFATSQTRHVNTTTFTFTMWDLDTKDTMSYVLFAVASAALLIYAMMTTFMIITVIASKMFLHKPSKGSELGDAVPGVSIIKPLMGTDPLLEHNLETYFKLTYPKDPAIAVVDKLHQCYPDVDLKLFIGGDKTIINPMVQNMAPAYEAAQYEYVWISTNRIEASDEIIYDMASKLQKPNVSLVHQIPFTTDGPSFGSSVEKIYFGSAMTRFYVSFNVLGLCCVTGMSYIFKKPLLDQAKGLAWYGRYLAEDFFLTRALHERGHMIMSAVPAQQNCGHTTVCGFVDRMVRWVRLRLNMMTAVTGVLEPLSDCFPLGIWTSWALYYFFSINSFIFFFVHIFSWLILDYIQLCTVQNGPLPFSNLEYVAAWVVRELTSTYVFILAVINPHYIKWGRRTYRVKLGGLAHIMEDQQVKKVQQM